MLCPVVSTYNIVVECIFGVLTTRPRPFRSKFFRSTAKMESLNKTFPASKFSGTRYDNIRFAAEALKLKEKAKGDASLLKYLPQVCLQSREFDRPVTKAIFGTGTLWYEKGRFRLGCT